MSDEPSIKRSLKIKTGVVKRLTKENNVYVKEVEDLKAKAKQIEGSGEDSWEVKNARNLVKETEKTLDLTKKKLKDEIAGLRDLVSSVENVERIKGDDSLANAQEALKDAAPLLEGTSEGDQ